MHKTTRELLEAARDYHATLDMTLVELEARIEEWRQAGYPGLGEVTDHLHERLAADLETIEARNDTIYRLQAELENVRLTLASIDHTVTTQRRRLSGLATTTNETADRHETARVRYADEWPE
jgi:chromosome segregation ATPase